MPYDAKFAIGPESTELPEISVLCANKNHGKFIEENIVSVLAQRGVTYEHIIIDGCSTDESLAIIAKYPHLVCRVSSNLNIDDAYDELARMARGRYVMITTSTDGYLGSNWFRKAVDVLETDPEISMVYANSQHMTEHGLLQQIAMPQLMSHSPPQKFDLFPTFIESQTPVYLPELNYCVRRDVFMECYFSNEHDGVFPEMKDIHGVFRLIFKFLQRGYLAHHVATVASFERAHTDQYTTLLFHNGLMTKYFTLYARAIDRYRALLRSGHHHNFRDGTGKVISRFVLPTLVFDVGAHCGERTVDFLAQNVKTVCFEPNPDCVAYLRTRFGSNPLVAIAPIALGVAREILPLCSKVTIETVGEKPKHSPPRAFSWQRRNDVLFRTLDSAIDQYGLPDYCKIDVRSQREVLKGLSQPIPIISLAFHSDAMQDILDCLETLRNLNYMLFNVSYSDSGVFGHPDWIIGTVLTSELQTHTEPTWGTVFATLSKSISPQVLPVLPSTPATRSNDDAHKFH